MRRDVGAELEHDLGVRRERDRAGRAVDAAARPGRRGRARPTGTTRAAARRAAAPRPGRGRRRVSVEPERDLDDAVRGLRPVVRTGVTARPACADDADPGREDDHAAVGEELDVDTERRPAGRSEGRRRAAGAARRPGRAAACSAARARSATGERTAASERGRSEERPSPPHRLRTRHGLVEVGQEAERCRGGAADDREPADRPREHRRERRDHDAVPEHRQRAEADRGGDRADDAGGVHARAAAQAEQQAPSTAATASAVTT